MGFWKRKGFVAPKGGPYELVQVFEMRFLVSSRVHAAFPQGY